jgi:2-polyprenyl-6-hydroxyphenyl methylase/3-demethylubiquinone-9 3-methyltransferase
MKRARNPQASGMRALPVPIYCGQLFSTTATDAMSSTQTANAANADPQELRKFEALAARFWDAQGEFRPLHLLNPVRTEFIARHATLAAARILDVGCGGGLLAESLARAGAEVTAIDLAPGMIEVARLHAAESALEIDYRVAAAEELLAGGTAGFDVITCMEMLEHVPDPAASVKALAALVKPGGDVIVSTINRNPLAFAVAIVGAEYIARVLPRGTHEYLKFIRPSELARWGREAQLELRDLTGIAYNPFTRSFRLSPNTDVNYLAHFSRPATSGRI